MTPPSLERLTFAWRARALALVLGTAALITLGLAADGEPVRQAFRATSPGQALDIYRSPTSTDSLLPMIAAYHRDALAPGGDLYSVFFDEQVKFQYPPSSLLVFDLLPRAWTLADGKVTKPLLRFWTLLSYLSVLLTVAASAVMLELRLAQLTPGAPALARSWRSLALSAALGLTFYPLMKGHDLGQIQVLLGCLAALALLADLLGREGLAGALLGACCLVKPQWGVVLVWALVRRRKRLAASFLAVFLAGTVVSLFRFGLADNLRYLDVLRAIGGTGEVYWPNQSVNGLLNRLFGNGNPVDWQASAFARPDALVRTLTMATSLAILGLALWPGRKPGQGTDQGPDPSAGQRSDRSPRDLPLALVAATLASPVAWEHHYGVLLPVLGLTLPDLARLRPLGRATGPVLAAAYLAIASVFLRPGLLFANRAVGLVGSHLFFGALALFVTLLACREASRRQPAG